MEKDSIYVHYLIGDLESFILDNKAKIDKLINNKSEISIEDSIYIFDKFSKSLKKTTTLIGMSNEVHDKDTLRTISLISSETVAWVMFTLPNVEHSIPVFVENLIINNRHIVDALGELLLEFDEYIEHPEKLKSVNNQLHKMLNDVSMFFGHLSDIIKKGGTEN